MNVDLMKWIHLNNLRFQMKVVKTRLLGAQPLMPIAQKNSYRVDAKNTVISAIQVSTEYPEHKFIFSFQIVELGTNKIWLKKIWLHFQTLKKPQLHPSQQQATSPQQQAMSPQQHKQLYLKVRQSNFLATINLGNS